MEKRMAVALWILGLILAMCGTKSQAADTGTLMVTVSLASETSVTLSPTNWVIGPVTLGATSGPGSFTASVGNSPTRLEIKGSDAAGGWTIGSSAAADRFAVSVTSPAMTLGTTYQLLAASVAAYGSQTFGLTYYAPTTDTKGGGIDQGFTIMVKASAP